MTGPRSVPADAHRLDHRVRGQGLDVLDRAEEVRVLDEDCCGVGVDHFGERGGVGETLWKLEAMPGIELREVPRERDTWAVVEVVRAE